MVSSDLSSIMLSILNRHPTADWTLNLRVDDMEIKSVEVHEIYSDDLSAKVSFDLVGQMMGTEADLWQNTFEDPERVIPEIKKYSAEEWKGKKRSVRAHSWQFIVVQGTKN